MIKCQHSRYSKIQDTHQIHLGVEGQGGGDEAGGKKQKGLSSDRCLTSKSAFQNHSAGLKRQGTGWMSGVGEAGIRSPHRRSDRCSSLTVGRITGISFQWSVFFSFPPFFHCICSEEIRDIPNSFLNGLLSVSLTVRPLLVTETAVHEDEHIVCHPSFVFLYFSPHCIFLCYAYHRFFFFCKFPLMCLPLQFDVLHMADTRCLTRTCKADEGDALSEALPYRTQYRKYRVMACTVHVMYVSMCNWLGTFRTIMKWYESMEIPLKPRYV